jgi:hypothetical protein
MVLAHRVLSALVFCLGAAAGQQPGLSPAVWRRSYDADRPELPRLQTTYHQMNRRRMGEDLVNLWPQGATFHLSVYLSTSSAPLTTVPDPEDVAVPSNVVALAEGGPCVYTCLGGGL